jgi:hypothetical protein
MRAHFTAVRDMLGNTNTNIGTATPGCRVTINRP